MGLILLIVLGLSVVCTIIGAIISIIGEIKNGNNSHSYGHSSRRRNNGMMGMGSGSFFGEEKKQKESEDNPYDNHWESSFDWKDEDNDGYDDRDDGFWNEREF